MGEWGCVFRVEGIENEREKGWMKRRGCRGAVLFILFL